MRSGHGWLLVGCEKERDVLPWVSSHHRYSSAKPIYDRLNSCNWRGAYKIQRVENSHHGDQSYCILHIWTISSSCLTANLLAHVHVSNACRLKITVTRWPLSATSDTTPRQVTSARTEQNRAEQRRAHRSAAHRIAIRQRAPASFAVLPRSAPHRISAFPCCCCCCC